jgi:hypothetical protein
MLRKVRERKDPKNYPDSVLAYSRPEVTKIKAMLKQGQGDKKL